MCTVALIILAVSVGALVGIAGLALARYSKTELGDDHD